jgi:hypothetical protein
MDAESDNFSFIFISTANIIKFFNYYSNFVFQDYLLLHYSSSSLNPVDISIINRDKRGFTVSILFS